MKKYPGVYKRILCIPDAHIPYHDEKCLYLIKEICTKMKPDVLIIMGDWWDFWKVSFHEKTLAHRRLDFDEEFTTGEGHLSDLSAPTKYFLEGNHEVRLDRYLASRAPEIGKLLDRKKIGVRHAVEALGWKFTPYRRALRVGKIYYSHDFGRAGKYAVHQNASDIQHSFIIGHTHRFDYAVEGDPIGQSKLGASFGWLGDFDSVDYFHRLRALREWAHGFGVGYMKRDGTTHYQPIPIVNSTACVEGRIFKV